MINIFYIGHKRVINIPLDNVPQISSSNLKTHFQQRIYVRKNRKKHAHKANTNRSGVIAIRRNLKHGASMPLLQSIRIVAKLFVYRIIIGLRQIRIFRFIHYLFYQICCLSNVKKMKSI